MIKFILGFIIGICCAFALDYYIYKIKDVLNASQLTITSEIGNDCAIMWKSRNGACYMTDIGVK